jgi:hypothetical protein
MDPWLEALIRYELNDPLVRMAQRLGLNPKKLGKISSNPSERWKKPLKHFIADLYGDKCKGTKLPPGGPIADAIAKGKLPLCGVLGSVSWSGQLPINIATFGSQ